MISDERRDDIFRQMNSYVLEIDPTAIGARYFIDKIAICRNHLNNVSLVLSELQREKLVTSSELAKLQTIIELESSNLLANDEHVRRLANIKDRESMVQYMLRERHSHIALLKDQLRSIDGVMKHVQLRGRELHATMDAIKNQRRFMQIEVSTGSFYGDERLPAHELNIGMGSNGARRAFGEGDLRELIEHSSSDEAVAEMQAAMEAAAEAKGFAAPKALPPAPTPASVVEEAHVLDDFPVPVPPSVVAETAPVVSEPLPVVEPVVSSTTPPDDEALLAFLGDAPAVSAAPPANKIDVPQPIQEEPSRSDAQVEIDDLSSLLDAV